MPVCTEIEVTMLRLTLPLACLTYDLHQPALHITTLYAITVSQYGYRHLDRHGGLRMNQFQTRKVKKPRTGPLISTWPSNEKYRPHWHASF
jgi:hypothetical protein